MTFADLQRDAHRVLCEWQAPDAAQEAVRREYLDHLSAHADAVSRDGVPHHLTSGGFVFDPTLEQVALVLHTKAQLWLQPGGHFEQTDATVVDAALREIREETGLPVRAEQAVVVDLHHHDLSAAFGRCRSHRDIRVAVVLDEPAEVVCSQESDRAAWWPVDALPSPTDPDLPATISRVRDQLRAASPRRAGRPTESAAAPNRS